MRVRAREKALKARQALQTVSCGFYPDAESGPLVAAGRSPAQRAAIYAASLAAIAAEGIG